MLAASNASLELVELLINREANVNFHKGIQFITKVVIDMYSFKFKFNNAFYHCTIKEYSDN